MTGFTTRPEIRGTFGGVSSAHWLASQTAMGVLKRGGNAFDAAAAGPLVLQISETLPKGVVETATTLALMAMPGLSPGRR